MRRRGVERVWSWDWGPYLPLCPRLTTTISHQSFPNSNPHFPREKLLSHVLRRRFDSWVVNAPQHQVQMQWVVFAHILYILFLSYILYILYILYCLMDSSVNTCIARARALVTDQYGQPTLHYSAFTHPLLPHRTLSKQKSSDENLVQPSSQTDLTLGWVGEPD